MPTTDEFFMRGALAMARRTLGRTWPNPAVGAVLVSPDDISEVISRGSTQHGGRPHAERVALELAGERAGRSTLYVTLEPCAHYGKTPPCTDAIIKAGVARVVCSAPDPDPRVSGQGFAALREAGIEVVEDVLGSQGRYLVAGHTLRVTSNRPMVQLKLAVGSDGLIPSGEGTPVWVTGQQARAHGHLLRARADAILVGRGTLEADNPTLTCRLPGMKAHSPVRILLDSNLCLPEEANLMQSLSQAPLWVIAAREAPTHKSQRLEELGVETFRVSENDQYGLSPKAVLETLAGQGITRLLIEGGPAVSGSFWNSGLVDEIYLYQGTQPAGGSGLAALGNRGVEDITHSSDYKVADQLNLDTDLLTIYRSAGL